MKKNFYFSLFVLLLVALFWPCQQVLAQTQLASDTTNVERGDTLWVGWQKTGYNTVRTNALRTAILSDTVVGGGRKNANRIYGLKNGGYYWEADDISFSSYTLRLVGGSFADANFPNGRTVPPMLQMADTRDDGTAYAAHLITASSSLTLKNLYISGCTNVNGIQTAYQPITFPANNSTFIVDNCVFTRSNFALVVITGSGNTVSITNNKFRNLIESPPTQQWTGRGVSIWADQKSVIMENNTFFNLGFASFQMEGGSAAYLRFNHNTLVNIGRSVMSGSGCWWQSAYFTNNLLVNVYWEGEGWGDMHAGGRDVRQIHDGYFHVATLPSSYGTQEARRVVIAKNAAYLDPLVLAKYGTPDTITRAWFMDPVSKLDYTIPYSVANGGGMYVADTTWLTAMPVGMTDYLRDTDWRTPQYTTTTGATMIDSMYKFINQVRNGPSIYTVFFYRPTLANGDRQWPLPENFAYTKTAQLTGTDGLPLGDLNWFPSDKTTFLAGQAGFVAQIEALAGAVKIDSVKTTVEAEVGVLGGTSKIDTTAGLLYYEYSGAGQMKWTFTVPTGKSGLYDMRWNINMAGRGNSGPNIAINGVQFVDKAKGWGQFYVGNDSYPVRGLSNSAWVWTMPVVADSCKKSSDGSSATPIFTLAEGTNTVEVGLGGWGTTRWAEIDLAPKGSTTNDTIKLKAVGAVPTFVTPGAFGGPSWIASLFRWVTLGNTGTIQVSSTIQTAGNYKLRVFLQNTSGASQVLTVKEGATTLASPNVASAATDVSTVLFPLTTGSHTFTLSGGGLNVDYVQVIKQDLGTGVNDDGQRPNAFALEQNYPNPFNPSTTINFTLGKVSNVKLSVYNILGQKVATLVDSRMNAGPQTIVFDASRIASGVYFYRLDAGDFSSIKKMLLLK